MVAHSEEPLDEEDALEILATWKQAREAITATKLQ